MKTPKEFYLVVDKDGRFWAGQGVFTKRPWQAKFYSVRAQAEKTAERCKGRVLKAKIIIEIENAANTDHNSRTPSSWEKRWIEWLKQRMVNNG